jgi:hypothetical protein
MKLARKIAKMQIKYSYSGSSVLFFRGVVLNLYQYQKWSKSFTILIQSKTFSALYFSCQTDVHGFCRINKKIEQLYVLKKKCKKCFIDY